MNKLLITLFSAIALSSPLLSSAQNATPTAPASPVAPGVTNTVQPAPEAAPA